jgi:hypothetical protein
MEIIMKKYLCIIPLILCLRSFSYSDTLGETLTRIRVEISDNNSQTTSRHYSDAYLIQLINNIQNQIAREAWAIIKSTYITTVYNTREYSLPSDACSVIKVGYVMTSSNTASHSVYKKLQWMSMKSLDQNPGSYWQSQSGLPTMYSDEVPGKIWLIPWPTTATSSATACEVWYVALPTQFDVNTDTTTVLFDNVQWMKPYHRLVTKGVLSDMGSAKDAQEFFATLKDLRQKLNDSNDHTQSMNQ